MKKVKYFIGVMLLCLTTCSIFTFAQEVNSTDLSERIGVYSDEDIPVSEKTADLPERIRVYSNEDVPAPEKTADLPERIRVYSDEDIPILPRSSTYSEEKELGRVIDSTDGVTLIVGAYLVKDRDTSKIYASQSKVLYVDLYPSRNHNFTDVQVTTSPLDSGRTFSVKVRGILHHPGPGNQKEVIIEYFDFR